MINTSSTTRENRMPASVFLKKEVRSVLIIGNNPIEMTSIYNILNTNKTSNYLAEVCFDVRDSFNLISRTKPEVILLDDNLNSVDTNRFIKVLRSNSKTKHIKVILLKSSNWNYNVFDHMDDYILKETISSDILDRLINRILQQRHYQIA